jgi:hypothetical protein
VQLAYKAAAITNADNVIYPTDVDNRLDDLLSRVEADRLSEQERSELEHLELLRHRSVEVSDWPDEILVRGTYFSEYARGLVDRSDPEWALRALELQAHDYHAIDFDGVVYWVRS